MPLAHRLAAVACLIGSLVAHAQTTLRVATFNLQDVRLADLRDGNNPRLRRLAEVIQRVRPNVILLNEIAYDMPGTPGYQSDQPAGQNVSRFIQNFLAIPQASNVQPIAYQGFSQPPNTGVASGFDLDNDGTITNAFPNPPAPTADGSYPAPDADAARYAGDCWGFGTFPGQYGMALLVDRRLTLLADHARTFRKIPWSYMDGAYLPAAADGTPWFTDEEARYARLSSKSHWDVPVRLPDGQVLHFLCSHPTPPAFDGPEQRNRKRNHDEIRFWSDYIQDTGGYIVDDKGVAGGLPRAASFVLLGDLNADPERGDSFKQPITRLLGSVKRLNMSFVPRQDAAPDASGQPSCITSDFGLRVDYVLPSIDLRVVKGGVWTLLPSGVDKFPSDHFPVWLDIEVPPAPAGVGSDPPRP